jgi:hypothetical protein
MENLPVRLDRFWKARMLKIHENEQQFCENLKFCICDCRGEDSNQIMSYLKEHKLL